MDRKGIALILVVSILTVVAITVVSFIFTMRLENRAAANYLWQGKARYIAEAGITHGLAVLKQDKENGFIDTYEDSWRSQFSGNDIDSNDDGNKDARWIELALDGEVVGRYAVLIEDEAAKININTAGYHNESPLRVTQGAGPFEVSLNDFFSAKGISFPQDLASALLAYRYGEDTAPGEKNKDDNENSSFLLSDGIDNDADGEIDQPGEGTDEPQEFVPAYSFGDDRPFFTTEQIKEVANISESIFERIKSDITAYSRTLTTDANRDLQWDINSIDAAQLLDVLLRSGVSNGWQKAANIIDFADMDFAQSTVVKSGLPFSAQNQGPNGDWQWQDDHYESKTYGGLKGVWTWMDIDAGEYFLFLYGQEPGQSIGDVTLGGLTQIHLESGDSFSLFPSGTVSITDSGEGKGSLTLAIQNNEALGTNCYFKYIELCSAEGETLGDVNQVLGTEGIRINEVMVQPEIELVAEEAQSPGGDWVWKGSYYENAASQGGIEGEGTWLWQDLPDGEYYLTVFGAEDGQMVGDVKSNGATQDNMRSGERFTVYRSVTVSGGTFRLDISNNTSGICYFRAAILSQQPDAEYVELVNLTPHEVSLDGWSLAASAPFGWPATIPLGTSIGPGEYLILAVDKDDTYSDLSGNGISFENSWGKLPAAQLDFSRSVTEDSDMFEDSPATGKGEIVLRDARGNTVDIQEYPVSLVRRYRSIEKADPTLVGQAEDIWFLSDDLSGATPAEANKNDGFIETIEGEIIEHSLDEIEFSNRPLANLGKIAQVSCGEAWKKIVPQDLASLADRLTTYTLRLEAEGHKEEGGWSESLRLSPQTAWFASNSEGEVGTWRWDEEARIPSGVYNLTLFGEQGEAVSVSLHLADGAWTSFTPPLTPGTNCGVSFGRIEIGRDSPFSLPEHTLELRIKNVSANKLAHFDYILLSPLSYVAGKINVNTASLEVLQALPKLERSTCQRIINARPFGNKEEKAQGIGDLLSGDILDTDVAAKVDKFGAISNLVTVRSDTYKIVATGQALRNGRVMAEKRIRAVVER